MVIQAEPFIVHAHVECRAQGSTWWRYAKPALESDPALCSVIANVGVDDDGSAAMPGAPADASPEVRDDYTFRVAGTYAFTGDDRTLDRTIARRLVEMGLSQPWPTKEPFDRITDPGFERATWMDRRELDRLLRLYAHVTNDLVPATYCAVLSMMEALERDYEVRLVLWLEAVVPAVAGDDERSSVGTRETSGVRRVTTSRRQVAK